MELQDHYFFYFGDVRLLLHRLFLQPKGYSCTFLQAVLECGLQHHRLLKPSLHFCQQYFQVPVHRRAIHSVLGSKFLCICDDLLYNFKNRIHMVECQLSVPFRFETDIETLSRELYPQSLTGKLREKG